MFETRRIVGGRGFPDDADVHLLSPITAIPVRMEKAQGRYIKISIHFRTYQTT